MKTLEKPRSRGIVLVGFAFAHHKGREAGYDKIHQYLKYDYVIWSQLEHDLLIAKTSNIALKTFRKAYHALFGERMIYTIIRCFILNVFRTNLTFHFIYPENSLVNLRRIFRRSNLIVCTLHQPESFYQSAQWQNRLIQCDKIITMSESMIPTIRSIARESSIRCIPHGVNCRYFSPPSRERNRREIAVVGNWLRDFHLAQAVCYGFALVAPDVKFKFVVNEKNFELLKECTNAILLSDISDDELRDLYQTCGCLFLPLKSFTANNAYLEAIACGCPVLIASDHNDATYATNKLTQVSASEPTQIINSLRRILNEPTPSDPSIVAAYDWPQVANLTQEFIRTNPN